LPRVRLGTVVARKPPAAYLGPHATRETIEGAMTAARADPRTRDSRTASAMSVSPSAGSPGHGWSDAAAARILIIDDEPQISGFIARALEHAGYEVDIASDAADGVRSAAAGRSHGSHGSHGSLGSIGSIGSIGYDLVILDLIMPDMDGRTALAAILRAHPAQPVLILSCNSDPGTKVECLDLGAMDYLTKPFSLAELIARVRARLRENALRSEIMQVGHLTLDGGRLVADSGAGPVALTRLEFLCLRALMEHRGDSVTKSELLAWVWGIEFNPGSNIVDVCIRRLRAKLGFALIETVRGEGYRLAS
jgi:two-component system, OmpR family, response regulator